MDKRSEPEPTTWSGILDWAADNPGMEVRVNTASYMDGVEIVYNFAYTGRKYQVFGISVGNTEFGDIPVFFTPYDKIDMLGFIHDSFTVTGNKWPLVHGIADV